MIGFHIIKQNHAWIRLIGCFEMRARKAEKTNMLMVEVEVIEPKPRHTLP